ncbi:NAD-dependent epimerase/dehydratase family protein [Winogradskyella sediminis]|uniref:NAD-dependent epimerase/dehydratase family protein n=1 Tax=Winogradskyella sediminis TaxID=1382466 RepID=UPI003AA967D1
MKKVIVLGATGSLGTYFVDYLVEQGIEVIACGRKTEVKAYYESRNIEYISIDMTKQDDFSKLPHEGVSAVVLISGAMPSRMEGYKPLTYLEVNALGTLNVLEYARKTGVEKFLFTQSHSDVAGHWNTGEKIKPDAPRILNLKGDHAVYIISKNTAVDLIEHYRQDYGLKTFIFRLPTIYLYRPILEMFVNGKNAPIGYRYFIDKATKSEPIEIWGDPLVSKDIVYVQDFNQMLYKALLSNLDKGFYNVASGTSTTLEDQIRGIIEVFSPKDKPSEVIYRPEKRNQNSYHYDIKNAINELGYKPEYSYIDMLKDMAKEIKGSRFEHLKNSNVTI